MAGNLVHIDNTDGHREAYLNLFANIFEFEKIVGLISRKNIGNLVKADKVLFATVGVSFRRYFLVCLIRSILNKPTAVLFLGASKFVKIDKLNVNFWLLKIWKALPSQQLLAITSYTIEPKLANVTNGYIYDPQLWDFWEPNEQNRLPQTELSNTIDQLSKGRKIILFLGKAKMSKAFDKFADFVLANKKEIFGIAAGKVMPECLHKAEELISNGLMVVDRYISDDELKSLYAKTNFVWCYYDPEYDQSSGVFGRAIQLGIPTVLRSNSIIERITYQFGIQTYSIELEKNTDFKVVYEKMVQIELRTLTESDRKRLFENLRIEAVAKLKEALRLD